MYIEGTGGGDDDPRIDTADEHYTIDANEDVDGDGINETATVPTDHGALAYVDENHDGRTDLMQHLDQRHVVLDQSRLDPATGRWLPEQPGSASPVTSARAANSLTLDSPQGVRDVGSATEDTNNDGRPDTATVDAGHGMMLVTDMDGDASADQTVRVDDTGEVTVSRHTGPGQWAVVDHRGVGQQESDAAQSDPGPPNSGDPSAPSSRAPASGDTVCNAEEPAVPADSREQLAAPPQSCGVRPDSDALWA